MGIFKNLASGLGAVVGGVSGGGVYLVGKLVGSSFLTEVGEGVCNATIRTGEMIGAAADGAVGCVAGIVQGDSEKAKKGLAEVCDTACDYVVGVGKGVVALASTGVQTVSSICSGDTDKAIECGKKLAKAAAITALTAAALDMADGSLDGNFEIFGSDAPNSHSRSGLDFVYDNPSVYKVNAPRTAAGYYYRTMPDASIANNLSALR